MAAPLVASGRRAEEKVVDECMLAAKRYSMEVDKLEKTVDRLKLSQGNEELREEINRSLLIILENAVTEKLCGLESAGDAIKLIGDAVNANMTGDTDTIANTVERLKQL